MLLNRPLLNSCKYFNFIFHLSVQICCKYNYNKGILKLKSYFDSYNKNIYINYRDLNVIKLLA